MIIMIIMITAMIIIMIILIILIINDIYIYIHSNWPLVSKMYYYHYYAKSTAICKNISVIIIKL